MEQNAMLERLPCLQPDAVGSAQRGKGALAKGRRINTTRVSRLFGQLVCLRVTCVARLRVGPMYI